MSEEDNIEYRHIGIELRLAREDRGLTEKDVAEDLNIQSRYITAIEDLDIDALPSVGYVLGYVRAYARHVGLDENKAVSQYKIDSAIPENLGLRNQPHFVPQRHIRIPKGFFAASTVMSCFAVLAFWYGSNTDAESASLVDLTTISTAVAVDVADQTNQEDLVTLKAVAPSWVEIKDKDGQVIMSRILVPGDMWQTERSEIISLSARDAGALEVLLGSQSLGRLGNKGEPIFDQPLIQP